MNTKCVVKALLLFLPNLVQFSYFDENGDYGTYSSTQDFNANASSDVFSLSITGSPNQYIAATILKDGYYTCVGQGKGELPTLRTAGDVIQLVSYNSGYGAYMPYAIAYCGASAPN